MPVWWMEHENAVFSKEQEKAVALGCVGEFCLFFKERTLFVLKYFWVPGVSPPFLQSLPYLYSKLLINLHYSLLASIHGLKPHIGSKRGEGLLAFANFKFAKHFKGLLSFQLKSCEKNCELAFVIDVFFWWSQFKIEIANNLIAWLRIYDMTVHKIINALCN